MSICVLALELVEVAVSSFPLAKKLLPSLLTNYELFLLLLDWRVLGFGIPNLAKQNEALIRHWHATMLRSLRKSGQVATTCVLRKLSCTSRCVRTTSPSFPRAACYARSDSTASGSAREHASLVVAAPPLFSRHPLSPE